MPHYLVRDRDLSPKLAVLAATAEIALARAELDLPGQGPFTVVEDQYTRVRLSDTVEDSGLSNREFARRILGRDVRTLSRYLGGEPIPPELADQVDRLRVVEIDDQRIVIHIDRTIHRGLVREVAVRPDFVLVDVTVPIQTPALQISRHRLEFREELRLYLPNTRWRIEYQEAHAGSRIVEAEVRLVAAFFDHVLQDGVSSSERIQHEPSVSAIESMVAAAFAAVDWSPREPEPAPQALTARKVADVLMASSTPLELIEMVNGLPQVTGATAPPTVLHDALRIVDNRIRAARRGSSR